MSADSQKPISSPRISWWRELTSYHWFVLAVAALGWLFDTMDQQIFTLARNPAITYLLKTAPQDPRVNEIGSYTTSIFLVGWALGGLIFGIMGDRFGRVRTILITILAYSIFTGLSAFSTGVVDFAIYRFLTGLGVGGEFAVGVSLVAEVMPDRARPHALGWLQASSAVGNMLAAITNLVLGHLEEQGTVHQPWRIMFLIGILPALLALPIIARLKEPDRWQAVAHAKGGKVKLGSFKELFGDPRWRRNAIVGMLLAFAGVVGLWSIAFFSFELVRSVFRKTYESEGLDPQVINGKLTFWTGITSLLLNFGGFWGVDAYRRMTHYTGRKPAFAAGFVLALLSTAFTFWFLKGPRDMFWMIPLMGFCQLTVFGGYAIYFPELFPTRLRSTGTSFCYNIGRLVSAVGPVALGLLTTKVFAGSSEPLRYAGVSMCAFFLIGLLALPFAPETRGQPLPD